MYRIGRRETHGRAIVYGLAVGLLSSGPRKIHNRATAAADELLEFYEISSDVGDQTGPIGSERKERVIQVVAFQHVTLLAAGDGVFRYIQAAFGEWD
jgi:hypothetical protein